jgi:hypothetical protein
MIPIKRLAPIAAVAAALLAAACKESTAPTPTDPTAMANAVTGLNSSLAQNAVFQSLSALSSSVVLAAAVVPPAAPLSLPRGEQKGAAAVAVWQLGLMRVLAARAPAANLALFPANVLTHTFQWDTASGGHYRIKDSTLTGAPANGVRFILYQVDTATFRPRLPLTTTGYVDLSDVSTAQANGIHLVLHVGSQTAADYTVTEVKTTTSLALAATGYVQDVVAAGPQITFTLSHTLSFLATDTTLVTSYQASGNGASVTMNSSSSFASKSLTFDWTLQKNGSIEVVGTETATAMNVQFKINGTVFATLTETAGGQPTFAGANGRTLSTGEVAALFAIVEGFAAVFLNLTTVFGPSLLFFV